MSDEAINVNIVSAFTSAGVTQAQKGIIDLSQSAQQIVASLREAAAAAGQDETAFLGMAGAASQAALATGDAAKAEQILAVSMGEGAAATEGAAVAAETNTTALGGMAVAANSAKAAMSELGIAMGAMMAIKVAADLTETGATAMRTETAFNNLAKTAGTTGDALLTAMRSASGNQISDMNLRLDASKAEFLGVAKSAQDFSTLLAIARNNAEQMGLTTEDAFNKLIDGLDKGTPRLLKQVGLNIDLKTAEADYAASIGTTVGQLDAQGKKQALVYEVMKQGEAQIKATGGAVEDTAAQIERGKAGFDNLKTSVGELAAIRLGPLAEDLGKITNAIAGAGNIGSALSGIADLGAKFNPAIDIVSNLTKAVDGAAVAVGNFVGIPIPDTFSPLRDSVNQWLSLLGLLPPATAAAADATAQLASTIPATATAINDNTVAINTGTMALQAHATEYAALMGVTQQSVEVSLADAAAKEEVAAKTGLLTAQTNAAVAAFMQLHPNISASGVAALQAAGQIDPLLAQLIQATLRAHEASAALAQFNALQGVKATRVVAGEQEAEIAGMKHSAVVAQETERQKTDAARSAAENQRTIALGTHDQKVALAQKEYEAAVKLHGAGSTEAYQYQTKLLEAEKQGSAKRAGGAAAAANTLTGIEQKTGDKIATIAEDAQKKITAIDEREAAKQAAALRKLNEDISTMTADRRASNEADDLDLIGVKDAKQAAQLNDRERAEASSRQREQQAQNEARAQAEAGDAESAQKVLAIRETQINSQQALDEKYYARQRELAGDPKNEAALKQQYDEATRAYEERAQNDIAIAKAEADQKKAAVQAEKDAVAAAAEDQANKVVSAATRSAEGVKKATGDARTKAVSDLHAIGDAVTAIPASKTITITVNQAGKVDVGSAGGAASSGNKSGGGGTFMTKGKTTLTVGDNPGGQEIVTVTPVSGKGTTSVSGNIAQLAGGGAVLIDAGGGYTTPIAGTGPSTGAQTAGGGRGAKPAAVDPKKALDELKNTVQLLMDMAKLKEEIASLASVPAFDIPLVQALVDRAQQFTTYVETHLVPVTKAQGEGLARYVTAATGAASIIKDLGDLKKAIAELKNVPAFDIPTVLALIDRAQQFTAAMQQRLIPLTEFEATQMSRYRSAVGDTVGILKDVADLKKQLATTANPILSDSTIISLADQATHIETLVAQRLIPATKEQADGLSQYASMVGSSTATLKSVLDLGGKLFTDYQSPSDAQIGMLAADAKRVADGVMAAASSYSTDGLAAGKAYAEGVGATFTAFKDGLLFFDALKSGDFKLDTTALASFETSTMATLDVAKRLGAVAATIPAGDIAALQTTTAALAAQSEALIKLAAVPFGDIPGAAANLAQQAGALLGGGGSTTIYNTFNLPAGANQQTVDMVIQRLNQQMGNRH